MGKSSDEEGEGFQPTLILDEHGLDAAGNGDAAGDVDEDATTIDEQSGDGAGAGAGDGDGDWDTAMSRERSVDREDEVQPTLILGTQILESPDLCCYDTQIIDENPEFLEENPEFLEENPEFLEENPKFLEDGRCPKNKKLSMVRAQSLRRSAMAAFERLVFKLELQGKNLQEEELELEDSARLVLEWGRKQTRAMAIEPAPRTMDKDQAMADGDRERIEGKELANFVLGLDDPKAADQAQAPSVVEENLAAAASGVCASTPISQTLKNSLVPALCSNNKKSTENRDGKSDFASGSPRQQENSLDKVRKALFDVKAAQIEDHRHHHPAQPLSAIVAPVRELSFLNSQEPGEESQAICFEALEKLVAMNGEYSQEAQMSEFDVEPKRPNLLSSHIVQLQRIDPSSVYDFVTSQEDPLMKAGEPGSDPKVDEGNPKDDTGKNNDETKAIETPDENNDRPKSKPRSSRRSSKTPATAKRKAASTPKGESARGKRRRKTASPNRAQLLAITVVNPDPDPLTPKNTSPGSSEAVPKSTTRKRKTEVDKLVIADDTPRQSRRKPVKVLFSHSLSTETIDEQKKLVKKLKFQVVESAGESTHFVTDRFLRTANMLEVLAARKPVVDLSWLESCSVAGCAVDERRFILADSKKEKELGFSMWNTYTAALQKPLLEGMRVHITPSTKPSEMVEAVVKAAGGKIVKKSEASGDCLVISCDEDRKYCSALMKKGVPIYSTEFLFSGVVSYLLDYSKNLLFDS